MRYAIISDIHSNLEALDAVVSKIDSLQVELILCLGDIVGYGANPNECVDIIKARAYITLCGNHDHAVIGGTGTEYFNAHARAAVLWTREVLRTDCAEFLRTLPLTASIDGAFLVHASPSEPERWNYILEPSEALHEFKFFTENLCFVGHSHFAMIFAKEGNSCKAMLPETIKLEEGRRYIVNVGSVGQPRDRSPTASFATLDVSQGLVEFHRVEYDYQLAYRKIMKARLPRFLAERLLVGE